MDHVWRARRIVLNLAARHKTPCRSRRQTNRYHRLMIHDDQFAGAEQNWVGRQNGCYLIGEVAKRATSWVPIEEFGHGVR